MLRFSSRLSWPLPGQSPGSDRSPLHLAVKPPGCYFQSSLERYLKEPLTERGSFHSPALLFALGLVKKVIS